MYNSDKKINIFVVSDSIGETGELIAKSSAIQFGDTIGRIEKFPFTLKAVQIDFIISEAIRHNAILIHTLVMVSLKEYLIKKAKENGLVEIDGIAPVINTLEKLTGKAPKREAGLNRKLNAEYFNKVEAVEFAVKYDDGKDPRGILKADLVLIGISRTSKTPLSMYLGYRNMKVCNFPLVPEVDPPKELYEISKNKIIGLTNDPDSLIKIRKERLREMGVRNRNSYANEDRIYEEITFASKVFQKIGCPVINVASKAIEETASIIMTIIEQDLN